MSSAGWEARSMVDRSRWKCLEDARVIQMPYRVTETQKGWTITFKITIVTLANRWRLCLKELIHLKPPLLFYFFIFYLSASVMFQNCHFVCTEA